MLFEKLGFRKELLEREFKKDIVRNIAAAQIKW